MTAAQPQQSETEPTLARCTVVVIEDHPDSRELLVAVLKSLRARVVVAQSLSEAERMLAQVYANLIVCDMHLPDGTGHDFIRWLRAQGKGTGATPCIAVTGYEQYYPASEATGFDAYMRKPLNLDRFCDVAVALARR